jgi:hypothetical protein
LWDQNGTTQLACAEENDAVAPQVWVIQRSGLTPGKKYIIEVTHGQEDGIGPIKGLSVYVFMMSQIMTTLTTLGI